MKRWEKIAGWVSAAPRELSQRRPPELYRIDIEQTGRDLDLQNEAKKLAAAGLPSPGQTELTAPEARTVQRIEKARHYYVEWASSRLNTLNEGLGRRDVTVLVNRSSAAHKTFEINARSRLAEHESLLQDLAANAAIRQRELEDFRARNRLTRPATYPEGSATFARYALLLALIVFEGAANAYFFSQGLESGLIGGFLAAGLFAAVNLVTAFVLGKYAVPLVYHRNCAVTSVGVVAVALAIVWMMAVGLTIGHFRDALIADAAEPARAAWMGLKSAPLGLRDVMSWLLFFVSVLFAVFALFDGLSSDDRYPGYGQVARRARESRYDYFEELHGIRKQLEELKEEALGALERDMEKARGLVAESASLLRDKNWARTKMETALLDAENCLDTLLKIFRDTNRMHRGGSPTPQYFDSRATLQRLALPDFSPDEDRARLDEQKQRVDQMLATVGEVRVAIQSHWDTLSDRLKPVDARWTGSEMK